MNYIRCFNNQGYEASQTEEIMLKFTTARQMKWLFTWIHSSREFSVPRRWLHKNLWAHCCAAGSMN